MTKLEFVGLVGDIVGTTLVDALNPIVMDKILTSWWMSNADDGLFIASEVLSHSSSLVL